MISVSPLGQNELPHQYLLVQLAVTEHSIKMLAFDEFEHDLVSEALEKNPNPKLQGGMFRKHGLHYS